MRIGELAASTGVSAKTLRFYEAEGLLHAPRRTAGGYRDYPSEVAERITFIRQAQAAGLTLRQIGEILAVRDDGEAPCRHVAELVEHRLAEVEQRLRELRATRDQLRKLKVRVQDLAPADCPPTAICAAVADTSSRVPISASVNPTPWRRPMKPSRDTTSGS
jgi:DNA-binding transcriptional MerR regulator